jgi:hypothetical protein
MDTPEDGLRERRGFPSQLDYFIAGPERCGIPASLESVSCLCGYAGILGIQKRREPIGFKEFCRPNQTVGLKGIFQQRA